MFAAAVLTVVVVGSAFAAPHIQGYKSEPSGLQEPCNNETSSGDVYDQRQNGTENYRINVNGVVVVLAPAEAILAAASLPNLDELNGMKPPPPVSTEKPMEGETSEVDPCAGGKCILANSTVKQRGKLKMMNNLMQFFRNIREDAYDI